jgi:hypothetical protein
LQQVSEEREAEQRKERMIIRRSLGRSRNDEFRRGDGWELLEEGQGVCEDIERSSC